jgi:hypothetical protein
MRPRGMSDSREIVEPLGHGGVIGPQHVRPDGQRPIEQFLRLLVRLGGLVGETEAVQNRRDVGVLGPEYPLPNGERSLEHSLRRLLRPRSRMRDGEVRYRLQEIGLEDLDEVVIDNAALADEDGILPDGARLLAFLEGMDADLLTHAQEQVRDDHDDLHSTDPAFHGVALALLHFEDLDDEFRK